jgi:hypothetical protein
MNNLVDLIRAIDLNDVERIKNILSLQPSILSRNNAQRRIIPACFHGQDTEPLLRAAYVGNPEVFEVLINSYGNIPMSLARELLMVVCEESTSIEIFKKVVDRFKSEILTPTGYFEITPLQWLVFERAESFAAVKERVCYLLRNGVQVDEIQGYRHSNPARLYEHYLILDKLAQDIESEFPEQAYKLKVAALNIISQSIRESFEFGGFDLEQIVSLFVTACYVGNNEKSAFFLELIANKQDSLSKLSSFELAELFMHCRFVHTLLSKSILEIASKMPLNDKINFVTFVVEQSEDDNESFPLGDVKGLLANEREALFAMNAVELGICYIRLLELGDTDNINSIKDRVSAASISFKVEFIRTCSQTWLTGSPSVVLENARKRDSMILGVLGIFGSISREELFPENRSQAIHMDEYIAIWQFLLMQRNIKKLSGLQAISINQRALSMLDVFLKESLTTMHCSTLKAYYDVLIDFQDCIDLSSHFNAVMVALANAPREFGIEFAKSIRFDYEFNFDKRNLSKAIVVEILKSESELEPLSNKQLLDCYIVLNDERDKQSTPLIVMLSITLFERMSRFTREEKTALLAIVRSLPPTCNGKVLQDLNEIFISSLPDVPSNPVIFSRAIDADNLVLELPDVPNTEISGLQTDGAYESEAEELRLACLG